MKPTKSQKRRWYASVIVGTLLLIAIIVAEFASANMYWMMGITAAALFFSQMAWSDAEAELIQLRLENEELKRNMLNDRYSRGKWS